MATASVELYCGDALEVMAGMADNSVDLIATDPPYFKMKGEWWDRQWDDAAEFLIWIGQLCEQWQRILRPNGSLYVFASPKMAARVEIEIGRWFNVLNHVVWLKDDNGTRRHEAQLLEKGLPRSYFPDNERIIFAEHYGADGYAKGEAGYTAKCDELRGFVFEPLRAYLDGERQRAGVDKVAINVACGFSPTAGGMASRHYFSRSQWCLPTLEHYQAMQRLFNAHNGDSPEYLRREYEDLRREYEDLRREYEDLRREYEDLRRPFFATAERPYTDVWTFPTVGYFNGKHPCEKPVELMQHIILTSSREGAIVLDCFMGRGSTAEACQRTGRSFIGIDIMEKWVQATERRLTEMQLQPVLLEAV